MTNPERAYEVSSRLHHQRCIPGHSVGDATIAITHTINEATKETEELLKAAVAEAASWREQFYAKSTDNEALRQRVSELEKDKASIVSPNNFTT